MISVLSSSGKHFEWLLAYLVRQKDERAPERVAWIATRNLPTDDLDLAATFMRATAAQSTLVQKPVYQIVVSFAPEDPVDRGVMERVVERVLARLGLAEHQAIVVAHGDRPHPHVHIVVNRVHPDTGRVWSTWQDWRRVRQVVAEVERALGLRPVSCRRQLVEGLAHDLQTFERVVVLTSEQARTQAEAYAARARATQLEVATARAQTAGARGGRALAQVYRDPDQAHAAWLAAAEQQGVADAARQMRERPEQFGALRLVERRRALGLGHTADEQPARAAAPAAAVAAQDALDATRAWQRAAEAEAQRVGHAFDRALEAIYADAQAARAAFERVASAHGAEHAGATLRAQAAALGAVRASRGQEERQRQERVAHAAACGVEAIQARVRATAAQAPGLEPHGAATGAPTGSEADQAAARDRTIRAELGALPTQAALQRRLGAALDRLSPRELRLLRRAVTVPQFAVARQLRRAIRDLALGRDDEREESTG